MAQLRDNLPQLPKRMLSLPIARGMPVPWFVQWLDGDKPAPTGEGVPEFRIMDGSKWMAAVNKKLCWVCGRPLGSRFTFVVGPMCGVNRVSSEPPSHRDCAEFSATACPFLTMPKMVRREDETLTEMTQDAPGIALRRNPGVALLWFTRSYEVFKVERDEVNPGYLIRMGDPFEVAWYAHGRAATREEVEEAIASGLPALLEACEAEATPERRSAARAQLEKQKQALMPLLPK